MTSTPSELQQIQPYIGMIEKETFPRRCAISSKTVAISAAEAINLDEDLSCLRTGIPLRHVLSAIGFDEKKVLKWRLDHKLVQALILKHYCRDAVPVTRGLTALLLSGERPCLDELTTYNNTPSLILKRTLGYASSPIRSCEFDRATIEDAVSRLESGDLQSVSLEEEQFIVQRRVSIEMEFRVHTLEDKVVDGLTYRKYIVDGNNADRDYEKYRDYAKRHDLSKDCGEANAFVRSMLGLLPNAMVAETLCGWDVARSVDGEWKIIEINYAGFHPVFERGFQCSGYFQDPDWGFARIAKLLHFIEETYAVQIAVSSTPCPDNNLASYYWWIDCALKFLRERDRLIEFIRTVEVATGPVWAIGKEEIVPAGIVEFRRQALQLETHLKDCLRQKRRAPTD